MWNALAAAFAFPDTLTDRDAALVVFAGTGATRRMPERPLTIATYAAGASLAAITLVYVFGPTFFLDDEAAVSSRSSRKKGVVGLVNPANDCFINSVLQALASLPELRAYLIREIHRRQLAGPEVYKDLSAALEEQLKNQTSKQTPEWKLLSLQQGLVTAGLKDVLNALNERPIYKKTISAQGFIRVVEESFRTRISRTQQDAQEFLQLVAERLADEHQAASRVRRRAKRKLGTVEEDEETTSSVPSPVGSEESAITADEEEENVFPLEGRIESQVECSRCHFKPKPSISSFASLTLHVPQGTSSTTLNACFDGMLKVEHIDDFVCDRCRLQHAIQINTKQLARPGLSEEAHAFLVQERDKLETALREDPERPPKDVKLPDLSTAPKRRISRHMRISGFPQILAIHLSRSVWGSNSSSAKNTAKVAFPETLPLGGLLERKTYRLLSVVTHKGGHNSGHYETFRRQTLAEPFSTKASLGTEGIYSLRSTPQPSAASSPYMGAKPRPPDLRIDSQPSTPDTRSLSSPSHHSPSSSSASSQPSLERRKIPPTSVPLDAIPAPGLPPPPGLPVVQPPSSIEKRQHSFTGAMALRGRKRKVQDRWWRISDDKVKESKTSDVLAMQKEVYLLFYEQVEEY